MFGALDGAPLPGSWCAPSAPQHAAAGAPAPSYPSVGQLGAAGPDTAAPRVDLGQCGWGNLGRPTPPASPPHQQQAQHQAGGWLQPPPAAPAQAPAQQAQAQDGWAVLGAAFCHPHALELTLQEDTHTAGCVAVDAAGTVYFRQQAAAPSDEFKRQPMLDAQGRPCATLARRPLCMRHTWLVYRGSSVNASHRVATVKSSGVGLAPALSVFLNDGDNDSDFKIKGDFRANHFRVLQKLPGGGERENAAIDREAGRPRGAPGAGRWRVGVAAGADAAFAVALAGVVREVFHDARGPYLPT
ncbi:MAG: tubby C-terminal-like domain-containing protein [Monoraphidium minutum]|nr:MAG: tubby C-terminal-like domain-containing protein [Monoraphidium minutum]